MAHRLTYWEDKNKALNESKKYTSRMEFCKGSYGAYTVSKKNGWLDEMIWLNRKNVYTDPVDIVYKYHFTGENAVYVGRTIYPELRDRQHRTREYDTVFRFANEHNTEIPEMEILEEGLTVTEGAKREGYWEKYYKDNGYNIINKQPCGSLGYMAKGKWSKRKCFEEAKKYNRRSDFQRNSSQAYHISMENGWIDEMDWMPKNNAKPSGYWKKNKDLLFNESKKYSTKNEFKKGNQSAYWAAFRFGWLNEMIWLKDGRKKSQI